MNVALFCASAEGLPADVVAAAGSLGQWIGCQGHTLLYGGVRKGLMEVTAQAVKAAGGRVVGVVPRYMVEAGLVSPCVDECVACRNLSERKWLLQKQADAFVVLPGGAGTLDELFSMLAAAQAGEHGKPIYLLNLHHFWEPLLHLLRAAEAGGYARTGSADRLRLVPSVTTLAEALSL